MTQETYFTHLFGGWKPAEAYRFINPDGSEGGIVAKTATIAEGVTVPADAIVWPDARISLNASIGDGASIGDRASIDIDDWLFVAGPQGSRNAFATVTYSEKYGLRWWIGCQHGIDTETLRTRIEEEHGDNEHAEAYRYLIAMVEGHPGLARKKAEIASKALAKEGAA